MGFAGLCCHTGSQPTEKAHSPSLQPCPEADYLVRLLATGVSAPVLEQDWLCKAFSCSSAVVAWLLNFRRDTSRATSWILAFAAVSTEHVTVKLIPTKPGGIHIDTSARSAWEQCTQRPCEILIASEISRPCASAGLAFVGLLENEGQNNQSHHENGGRYGCRGW